MSIKSKVNGRTTDEDCSQKLTLSLRDRLANKRALGPGIAHLNPYT